MQEGPKQSRFYQGCFHHSRQDWPRFYDEPSYSEARKPWYTLELVELTKAPAQRATSCRIACSGQACTRRVIHVVRASSLYCQRIQATHLESMYVCIYRCMYIFSYYIHVSIHMHIHVNAYIICIYVCTYVLRCVYIHTHLRICACIYIERERERERERGRARERGRER